MLKNERCYSYALLGLIPMLLVTAALFSLVAYRSWQAEQDYQAIVDEFEANYARWRAQMLTDYTVIYTNCNPAYCCQDETLRIRDGQIQEALSCATITYWPGGYVTVRSMAQLYVWLDSWGLSEYRSDVKLEYDDEFHHISRLVIEDPDGASLVEIEYRNLVVRPQDD